MRCRAYYRFGLTYFEVLISLIILSVAIAAGMRAFGSFSAGARQAEDRIAAIELANQLMTEIVFLPFEDPLVSGSFGLEQSEATAFAAGNRPLLDDVDDYNGWNFSPPRDRSGVVMTDYADYRQQVNVAFAQNISTSSGIPVPSAYVKLITVKVLRGNRELARLVTLRTKYAGSN